MKRFVRVLVLVCVGSLAGPAAAEPSVEPLLVKVSGSGYTPIDWVRREQCALYQDKVVITRSFGAGHEVVEERPLVVRGDIAALIEHAHDEDLAETDNFLCDGPATFVGAGGDRLTLYGTGGCGQPRQDRQGPASAILRDIIDAYCPTTH
jgi:hypothetical protein